MGLKTLVMPIELFCIKALLNYIKYEQYGKQEGSICYANKDSTQCTNPYLCPMELGHTKYLMQIPLKEHLKLAIHLHQQLLSCKYVQIMNQTKDIVDFGKFKKLKIVQLRDVKGLIRIQS